MHMTPPDIDSVETPYTWVMAAQVTACAQMIDLHQDTAMNHIPMGEEFAEEAVVGVLFD
jgi:hypothetical protein